MKKLTSVQQISHQRRAEFEGTLPKIIISFSSQ
jgi:hypothetical protein